MHHEWFTSVDAAAAFAVQGSARGVEVYHACSSFQSPGSRKASNVHRIKALWLDLDVGEGKPYADDRTALAALLAFCSKVGLPTPTLVHSGGGWHAYWPLTEPVSVEDWLPQAQALKSLCAQHGLQADPVRTADAASILRPPGTYNYKSGSPRPVAVRHKGECFAGLVSAPQLGASSPPAGIFGANDVDNSKFTAKPVEEPSSAAIASLSCRQLANFKLTGGRLAEPEWYASLCVLAHCTDGEQLAHEWSAGDERYNAGDTSRKLDHARRDSGPTTCIKFQQINPTHCVGCPHNGKIGSPIQLGRQAPTPTTPIQDVLLPNLPEPFEYGTNRSIFIKVPGEQPSTTERIMVYKAPLFLESMREHEVTGQTSLMLKHFLPFEGWQDVIIPWTDHSTKVVLNALGANKINIYGDGAKYIPLLIHKFIDQFQANRRTDMEYAQFGWRNDFKEFLLGNELYVPGAQARVIGTTPELLARARMMKAHGSFEGWRSAAQRLYVHPQQGLLVTAGFASILMKFVTELTGVIIAAVSPEPRLGKTMGLVAARTIWGDDNAVDIATNDTSNARFKMLAVLNGLPATWDDMRKSNDPEIIKQFVLSFSQGRDKNRLDRSGSLRANNSGWASLLLATSNISIAELVGHDGETAQQARILEYRFQKIDGIKFSDGMEYERILRANRGTAGRRFIQGLMQPGVVEWCRKAVPLAVAEYEQRLASQQASFYASALGCIKVAAILLNKLGMLEFSTDRVMDFAVECATGMTAMVADSREECTSILTRFINESWPNTLIVQDSFKPKTDVVPRHEPRAVLAVRYEINPGRVYIERMFLRKWCKKHNIMFHDLEKQLSARHILLATSRRLNLGAGTAFSGAGQTSVWDVDVRHEEMGNIRIAGVGVNGTEETRAANAR